MTSKQALEMTSEGIFNHSELRQLFLGQHKAVNYSLNTTQVKTIEFAYSWRKVYKTRIMTKSEGNGES